MSFDKIIGDLSQGVRRRDIRKGAPSGLEPKILAALTDPAAASGGLALVIGLLGGLATVGALGTGLVALTHRASDQRPSTHAAPAATKGAETPIGRESDRIQAAVDAQNTWHLSGHFRGGKAMAPPYRVSDYDIWERRSPFFYREDRYGETIIDDGKTLIHVIPPRRVPFNTSGVTRTRFVPGRIVIHASKHTACFSAFNLEGLLVGSNGRPNNTNLPLGSSPKIGLTGTDPGTSLRLANPVHDGPHLHEVEVIEQGFDQLTVDKQTHLPIEFSRIFFDRNAIAASAATRGKPVQSDTIQATYMCPLPTEVTKLQRRPGYSIIDLTESPVGRQTHEPPTYSEPDRQIQPKLLAADPSGACAIHLATNFEIAPEHRLFVPQISFAARDEQGTDFVCVNRLISDRFGVNLLVAPASSDMPRAQNGRRQLTITCNNDFTDRDPDSSLLCGTESRISTSSVLTFPSNVKPSTIDESLMTDIKREPRATIREKIAVARANYFSDNAHRKLVRNRQKLSPEPGPSLYGPIQNSGPVRSIQLSPEDAAQAAQWWDVAADEAERIGTVGIARQYRAQAQLYRKR